MKRSYDRTQYAYADYFPGLNAVAKETYDVSVKRGKWDVNAILTHGLSGIQSEVDEMYEALKNGNMANLYEEMIDTIIATMSCLEYAGVNIETELMRKHRINLERAENGK